MNRNNLTLFALLLRSGGTGDMWFVVIMVLQWHDGLCWLHGIWWWLKSLNVCLWNWTWLRCLVLLSCITVILSTCRCALLTFSLSAFAAFCDGVTLFSAVIIIIIIIIIIFSTSRIRNHSSFISLYLIFWPTLGTEYQGLIFKNYNLKKIIVHSNLPANLIFQPIAVENLGVFSSSSSDFISALGHKISSVSGEERKTSFFFQHLSVALQWFSAVLLHDTFMFQDDPDQ